MIKINIFYNIIVIINFYIVFICGQNCDTYNTQSTCESNNGCEWIYAYRRCVHNDRQWGEPCNLASCATVQAGTSLALKCSTLCGVCIYDEEADVPVAPPSSSNPSVITCGKQSTVSWANWAETVISNSPVLYPQNEAELQNILSDISGTNCKVRITGTTHSAPGVVRNQNEPNDIVVVSLAQITNSNANWDFVLDQNTPSIRVPGKATQLDIYQVIRQHNLWIPSQTAGWFFTIAGIILNSVHGGGFSSSYINSHLTGLRVMWHDGTISELFNESDLRMWRNSFGLHGIVLGVEIKLEKRDQFRMWTTEVETLPNWDENSLLNYINGIKNDPNNIAAEYFYDPYNKEFITIVNSNAPTPPPAEYPVTDDDCNWSWLQQQCRCDIPPCDASNEWTACEYDYQFGDILPSQSCRAVNYPTPTTDEECTWNNLALKCHDSHVCSYQYRFGDLNFDKSCRLTIRPGPDIPTIQSWYQTYKSENPQLEYTGVLDDTTNFNLLCFASRTGLEGIAVRKWFEFIAESVSESYDRTNDGFFIYSGLPAKTPLLSYFFKKEFLFEVLDAITVNYKLNAPVEFRIVNIQDKAVLQPGNVRSGEWINIDIVQNVVPGAPNQDDWRQEFKNIEAILQQYGFPHTGKVYGFDNDPSDGGLIKPFINNPSIFTAQQQSDFQAYRTNKDPQNLFYAGAGVDLLNAPPLTIQYFRIENDSTTIVTVTLGIFGITGIVALGAFIVIYIRRQSIQINNIPTNSIRLSRFSGYINNQESGISTTNPLYKK